MVVVLEIGLITPPVGLNVFVINGVAPDLTLKTIFKGIMPFIAASTLAILLLILFPGIATYIPSHMK